MNKVKNRRTLKKRIKRAISLSAFITVLVMSSIIIFIILVASQSFATYQSEVVSYEIQKEINSGQAFASLGIGSIEEVDENNPLITRWVEDLNKKSVINTVVPYLSDLNTIYITIMVKDRIIYSNEIETQYSEKVSEFYDDTQSIKPIYDKNGNEIGQISVRINPQFLLSLVIPLLSVIVILSLVALLVS